MGVQAMGSLPKEKHLELRSDGLVGVVWTKGLEPSRHETAALCWVVPCGCLVVMCQRAYQSTLPKSSVKKIIIRSSANKKILRNMKSKNSKLDPKESRPEPGFHHLSSSQVFLYSSSHSLYPTPRGRHPTSPGLGFFIHHLGNLGYIHDFQGLSHI